MNSLRDLYDSSKEEKPTLKGVNVKQRKRNIAIPLDPGAFAESVLSVFEEHAVGETVQEKLESAVKALDSNTSLDFNRYGDTLFEILFAGRRMAAGANLVSDHGRELQTNVHHVSFFEGGRCVAAGECTGESRDLSLCENLPDTRSVRFPSSFKNCDAVGVPSWSRISRTS